MTTPGMGEPARRALACLDLTNLDENCTTDDIGKLCARATTPHGHVAAICIYPRFVKWAKTRLKRSPVKVATVVNFPAGGEDTAAVAAETERAVKDGADEIDLVLPFRRMDDDPKLAEDQIVAVCEAAGEGTLLKVILETGELKEERLIRRAAEIAIRAGANFIKTSTGKVPVNATPEAARIMLSVIADYGGDVGFKAAGGIRTVADAAVYLDMADEMLGPDWAKPETFRFGASGLLDSILATIEGREGAAGSGY
jgi:deoxyribose-phosphate aldolase